ncbi:MAG: hypothetical protein AMJ93_07805 [Anaerolineae bacterium SM23_84]|nr:MAG: hypothetical protein AMJ93_07805 [Anaerolineae bacterium SM23_84]
MQPGSYSGRGYWGALARTGGHRGAVLCVALPGHSDDSVSLLLDDGSAFTGDLTPPQSVGLEDAEVVSASWRLLRERGATRVYPGHGPIRQIDAESIV